MLKAAYAYVNHMKIYRKLLNLEIPIYFNWLHLQVNTGQLIQIDCRLVMTLNNGKSCSTFRLALNKFFLIL